MKDGPKNTFLKHATSVRNGKFAGTDTAGGRVNGGNAVVTRREVQNGACAMTGCDVGVQKGECQVAQKGGR